jgi:hypothetical protein
MEIVDLRPRTGDEKERERERERERDQEQWSGRRETRVGEGGSLQERIAADSQGCGIGRGPLSSAPAPYIYPAASLFRNPFSSSSSRPWMAQCSGPGRGGSGTGTGNRPGRAPDVDAGLSGLAVLFPRASVVSPRVQARGQPRRWKERSWASLVVLPRSVPPHKERSRPSSPPPCSSSPRLVTHARGSRGCRCTQTTLLPPRLSFYPCLIGSRWSAGQC